jgi:hypothetical protein
MTYVTTGLKYFRLSLRVECKTLTSDFPGIFPGALDVQASTITDEICLAAEAPAHQAGDQLSEHILPTMDDWRVFAHEAVAVGEMARGGWAPAAGGCTGRVGGGNGLMV